MTKEPATNALAAVLWVAAGTALFSLVFASGKLAGNAFSPYQILFLRYLSALAIVSVLVVVRGVPVLRTAPGRIGTHALRAACGSLGGVCTIQATGLMPVVDASAIGLTEGLLTVLFGVLFLRETVSARHWGAIATCALGAAVVTFGNGAFGGDTTPVDRAYLFAASLAFLGAVLIAIETVLIRVLSLSELPLSVLFFVSLFGTMFMAGPAFATWKSGEDFSGLMFLALGPVALLAQLTIILGFRRAPVSVVGPVGYSWIIFAGLIGLVAFGEVPTLETALGSALIVIGGGMLARLPADGARREAESEAPVG